MRLVTLALLGCLAVSLPAEARNTPAPSDLRVQALAVALSRQGDAYVWGGQSPGGFDCSGLILWAYERVTPGFRLPDGRGGYVTDATMDHLWRHAVKRLPPSQVRPGDVVFITSDEGRVTHGGLVISISDTEVTFVNASSYHGEVTVESWPLVGKKRDQWVVGFGRLLVIPGRRPPTPLPGEPWFASSGVIPFIHWPAAFFQATVSKDGLQAELAALRAVGPFRVGVGYWVWQSGWRGRQYIAAGERLFGLVGGSVSLGPVKADGQVTYSDAGTSYGMQMSVAWPTAWGQLQTRIGYRHWAEDPWYTGPVASLGIIF